MDGVSSPKKDSRTSNEKAKELMDRIPLNSFWHKVSTHNREQNKVLSYNEDINQGDDPNIITTHEYYNVYAYTSSRDGNVYNKCVEIKYDDNSWRIYPTGCIYEFDFKNCTKITKEEFEKLEDNFVNIYCHIEKFSGKLVLLDEEEESSWPVGEEWDKLIKEHPYVTFIRRKFVPYSELKIGDRYVYFLNRDITRIGQILSTSPINSEKTTLDWDKKKFIINERQVTISQKSENIVSEQFEKRELFVLISELKKTSLCEGRFERFCVINEKEWNEINFIIDNMKIEMNMSMSCDLDNAEECMNYTREKRIEKIME